MGRDATARVRLTATGTDKVRAALRGTTSESRKAQQAIAAGGTATQRTVTAMNALASATKSATGAAVTQKRVQQELQRAVRDTAREAERSARAQSRAASSAQREARRAESRRERRNELLGGALATAGGAALSAAAFVSAMNEGFDRVVEAVRTFAGVQSTGEGLVAAARLDTRVRRLVSQVNPGMTGRPFEQQVAATTGRINQIARVTNVPQEQLAGALAVFQDQFSSFEAGVNVLDLIGQAATQSGADMIELSSAVGQAAESFGGLGGSAEEQRAKVQQILALISQQGLEGAITPEQFAQVFQPTMGQFTQFTGRQDFAEFGAAVQAMAHGAGTARNPERTRTLLENLMGALGGNREVQNRLAERGIFTRELTPEDIAFNRAHQRRDRRGRLRGPWRATGERRRLEDLIPAMRASGQFETEEQLGRTFTDRDQRAAALGLLTEERRDPGSLRRRRLASTERGTQLIQTGFRNMMGGAQARFEAVRVRDVAEHGAALRDRSRSAGFALEAMQAFDQLFPEGSLESTIAGLGGRGNVSAVLARDLERVSGAQALLASGRARGPMGLRATEIIQGVMNPENQGFEAQTMRHVLKGRADTEKASAIAQLGPEAADRFAAALAGRTLRVEVTNMPQTIPGGGAAASTPSGTVDAPRRDGTPPRARGR